MANNFHGLGRKHEFLVPVRLSSLPSYAFPPSSPPGYVTFVWLTVPIMLYLSSFPYRLINITKIPRSGHGTSPKFPVSVNMYILNSQFRPCSIPLVPRPVSATLHSPDFLWAMRHSPTWRLIRSWSYIMLYHYSLRLSARHCIEIVRKAYKMFSPGESNGWQIYRVPC